MPRGKEKSKQAQVDTFTNVAVFHYEKIFSRKWRAMGHKDEEKRGKGVS